MICSLGETPTTLRSRFAFVRLVPPLQICSTPLNGMVTIEPHVFEDHRGFFAETFNKQRFGEVGLPEEFVQQNYSRSRYGTLRGLHYQIEHPQGKLVRAVRGTIFDVAVDLRRDSPTFGQWSGVHLTEVNCRQLYVPPGFAHGFCVLSDVADVVYGCTDFYHSQYERTILWNDAQLAIDWPIDNPVLSDKDRRGVSFEEAPYFNEAKSLLPRSSRA